MHYRVFEVGIRVGIKGLPELTESQLGRLEDEIRRERQRRVFRRRSGCFRVQKGASPPLTEVLEYRPLEDGSPGYSLGYAATLRLDRLSP